MTTITTAAGRTRRLPVDLEPSRVFGLDPEGRIVVNDFDGAFMFGLTLCCDAADKGVENGVVCRACYDTSDVGSYLFPAEDGSFPGLDVTVAVDGVQVPDPRAPEVRAADQSGFNAAMGLR